MRFQQFQIPAFGPFTQLDLQFPSSPSDLHLIYGANEAGKSSLLRAIRDLLFGIHGQSSDNFLHDYKNLRIKAEIANQAGKRLTFQRRKGNKNTLLDENDGQLPDNALSAFLGGVDQSYFSAMFGLGAPELREGAADLLQGKGDMGKALFSASMGGTPIQKVIDALQADADRILKGRATTNVTLRPAIKRYKELLKQSRDAMVNPEAWTTVERGLEQANARKKQLETEIADLDNELAWIQRCEDALPTVGRLNEETEKLHQLPRLPALASDYPSRAKSAREGLKEAQAEAKRLEIQKSQLQSKRDDCQTLLEILSQGEQLDQLHQDLSVYRDRKKSLDDWNAKLAGLEPTLKAEMKNLQFTVKLPELENHRLSSPIQLACQEAAEELNQAVSGQSANAEKVEAQLKQIADLDANLQSLPEQKLDDLQEALAVALEATDAHKTIAATQADAQKRARETADKHRLLIGAPDDYEETAQLPIPALATIKRYAAEFEDLKREIVAEEKEERESKRRQATLQSELNRLQRQGELPTEQALHDAREFRDRGWKLVLEDWKGDGAKEELQPGTPLEKAFPDAIKNADNIADQLRNDAELVAQADEKRFQLEEVEQRIQTAQKRIEELQGSLSKRQDSWTKEWSPCALTPSAPAEMEEWHAHWREFRDRLEKLNTAKDLFEEKSKQIQEASNALASALDLPEDKEFSQLLSDAKKRIQDGEQATAKRQLTQEQLERLKRELGNLESDQKRIEKVVEAATEKWASQCETVGLPPATSPTSGLKLLQDRQNLFSRFDEWQEARNRASSLSEAISQYEKNVDEKAATLDLAGETTESTVSTLWNKLKKAREAQTRHKQLAEQLEQAEAEFAEANQRVVQSQKELDELIKTAQLQNIDELEPLLANLEQSQALQSKIDQYRDTLSGLARGLSVDDFIAKVRAEDPNTLSGRKAAASREKDEKQRELSETNESLYQLLNDKKALEAANDAAADYRQQAESCAATLKQDAARFARLSLAIDRLKSQIERFRKENQGPLLQKSGEVFREITRGSFAGLGADFNADDTPVLVGTRPDQSKVPVEGMSEGSRDQLYLALRLAALDRYLDEHEPMPLILDDLLITFDNHRSKAILPQLSELAKRTQVFLFTHHEHLVDLCQETLGESGFKLHHLERH